MGTTVETIDNLRNRLLRRKQQIGFRIVVLIAFAVGAASGMYGGIHQHHISIHQQEIQHALGKMG